MTTKLHRVICLVLWIFTLMVNYTIVSAAELPVKDVQISSHNIFILTEEGDVYSSDKNITTQHKNFIVGNVKAINGSYFITNENDLYYYNYDHLEPEQPLKNVNAKQVINWFDRSYVDISNDTRQGSIARVVFYIDIEDNLKFYVYDSNGNNDSVLIETDVQEVLEKNSTGLESVFLVQKKNGEVYFYEYQSGNRDEYYGFNSMSLDLTNKLSKKFVASDVYDVSYGSIERSYSLLKNNGELLNYSYRDGLTNVWNHNISHSLGLHTYDYNGYQVACADNNGTLYNYYSDYASTFQTGRTIKDLMFNTTDGQDKFIYIDENGLLFETKRWGGKYSSENTFCLSDTIRFKKLYYGGAFALSENNKLYLIGTSVKQSEPNALYELEGVSVPVKIVGQDNRTKDRIYLIIDANGDCWGISGGSYEPFLTSFCQKKLRIFFKDNELVLTQKIQNVDGRTMYPFRECLENMGVSVIWDQTNQIAIGEISGKRIEFPIGKSEYYINGIKYDMDVPSYIDSSVGRTYIPIRYAAEGLGYHVNWLPGEAENIITIK